jgi:hypothetical protein
MLTFPPHTTHQLQPLDDTAMSPLSTFYEQEVRKWMFNHPGRGITIYEVGKMFNAAFQRAALVQTAVNGFKKTGIFPYNPDVFPEYLYPLPDAQNRTSQQPLNLQQNEARFEGSSSSVIASKSLQSSQPLETVLNESPSDGGTDNTSTNAGLIQPSTSTENKGLVGYTIVLHCHFLYHPKKFYLHHE